jgi:hypothetical protein
MLSDIAIPRAKLHSAPMLPLSPKKIPEGFMRSSENPAQIPGPASKRTRLPFRDSIWAKTLFQNADAEIPGLPWSDQKRLVVSILI